MKWWLAGVTCVLAFMMSNGQKRDVEGLELMVDRLVKKTVEAKMREVFEATLRDMMEKKTVESFAAEKGLSDLELDDLMEDLEMEEELVGRDLWWGVGDGRTRNDMEDGLIGRRYGVLDEVDWWQRNDMEDGLVLSERGQLELLRDVLTGKASVCLSGSCEKLEEELIDKVLQKFGEAKGLTGEKLEEFIDSEAELEAVIVALDRELDIREQESMLEEAIEEYAEAEGLEVEEVERRLMKSGEARKILKRRLTSLVERAGKTAEETEAIDTVNEKLGEAWSDLLDDFSGLIPRGSVASVLGTVPAGDLEALKEKKEATDLVIQKLGKFRGKSSQEVEAMKADSSVRKEANEMLQDLMTLGSVGSVLGTLDSVASVLSAADLEALKKKKEATDLVIRKLGKFRGKSSQEVEAMKTDSKVRKEANEILQNLMTAVGFAEEMLDSLSVAELEAKKDLEEKVGEVKKRRKRSAGMKKKVDESDVGVKKRKKRSAVMKEKVDGSETEVKNRDKRSAGTKEKAVVVQTREKRSSETEKKEKAVGVKKLDKMVGRSEKLMDQMENQDKLSGNRKGKMVGRSEKQNDQLEKREKRSSANLDKMVGRSEKQIDQLEKREKRSSANLDKMVGRSEKQMDQLEKREKRSSANLDKMVGRSEKQIGQLEKRKKRLSANLDKMVGRSEKQIDQLENQDKLSGNRKGKMVGRSEKQIDQMEKREKRSSANLATLIHQRSRVGEGAVRNTNVGKRVQRSVSNNEAKSGLKGLVKGSSKTEAEDKTRVKRSADDQGVLVRVQHFFGMGGGGKEKEKKTKQQQ